MKKKGLRATKNIRVYPETLRILQDHKSVNGGSLAGLIHALSVGLQTVKK